MGPERQCRPPVTVRAVAAGFALIEGIFAPPVAAGNRWKGRSPDGALSAFTRVFDALWRHPGSSRSLRDPRISLALNPGYTPAIYILTVSLLWPIFRIIPARRRAFLETCLKRSREWRPAAAARNRRLGRLGTLPARHYRPGCEELAGRIPEEMPETEARTPAKNRHGGAPRGVRVDRKTRAAPRKRGGRASHARQIGAFSALRSPLGRRKKERRGARARRSAGKAERWLGLFDR